MSAIPQKRDEKIKKDLEDDIKKYCDRFHKLTETYRRQQFAIVLSSSQCDCSIIPMNEGDAKSQLSTPNAPDKSQNKNIFDIDIFPEDHCHGDYDAEVAQANAKATAKDNGKTNAQPKPKECKSLTEFSEYYLRSLDPNNTPVTSPTASQTYFHAAELGRPYKFDYHKIFNMDPKEPANVDIKTAFIEALDSDITRLRLLQDLPPSMDAAIDKAAKGKLQKLEIYEQTDLTANPICRDLEKRIRN